MTLYWWFSESYLLLHIWLQNLKLHLGLHLLKIKKLRCLQLLVVDIDTMWVRKFVDQVVNNLYISILWDIFSCKFMETTEAFLCQCLQNRRNSKALPIMVRDIVRICIPFFSEYGMKVCINLPSWMKQTSYGHQESFGFIMLSCVKVVLEDWLQMT